MTREEILAMKPGRELDALVAEKVMGLKHVRPGTPTGLGCLMPGWEYIHCVKYPDGAENQPVHFYSTNISAAWEVRERIHETIGGTEIVILCDELPELCQIWNGEIHIRAQALTAPEAICKAALLAVMEEE